MGLDPESFWRQTPVTYRIIMGAKAAALEARHRDDAWLAWHIACLGMIDPKKYPTLQRFMGAHGAPGDGPKKPTPWQVQFEAAKAWDKRINQQR